MNIPKSYIGKQCDIHVKKGIKYDNSSDVMIFKDGRFQVNSKYVRKSK